MSKKAAIALKEKPAAVEAAVKAAVREAVAGHHKAGLPVYTHHDGLIWKVSPNGSEKPYKKA